jgi:hypothetical protein
MVYRVENVFSISKIVLGDQKSAKEARVDGALHSERTPFSPTDVAPLICNTPGWCLFTSIKSNHKKRIASIRKDSISSGTSVVPPSF